MSARARLLAAFRKAWGDDYIDFSFDRYEDTDEIERFAAALESALVAEVFAGWTPPGGEER